MSVADDIKSKLDIVAYIQRTVPLKRAGRVYKACCPFHNERTPSFVVNPATQTWRCFGACAEGGDIYTFAMKQNGWTFREALEELGRSAGVEVRPQTPEQRASDDAEDRLRGLARQAAEYFHERLRDPRDRAARAALAYTLEKRALTDATIDSWQIGFAPPGWDSLVKAFAGLGYSENDLVLAGLAKRSDEGRVYDAFRNRLMIPISDERGRIVGFGARALAADDQPKYLNSPQSPIFDKSRLLFGLHTAARAIRDQETVVIVEGYLDALQAQQAGYLNVVAQMGTALTETQLKLVAPRWARKVILALDSDAAGQNATRRSLEVARATLQADFAGKMGVEFRVLTVPGAKDPDDLIRENPAAWAELVEQALPVADFVIALELQDLPASSSVQEREQAARRLLPLLTATEDDLYRTFNMRKLAMKLKLSERDLLRWVGDQQAINRASAPRSSAIPEVPAPELPDDQAQFASRQPTIHDSPTETDLEAYCLRVLLKSPDSYYSINRKLRELAAADPALLHGPLINFSADDFSRTAYRELMRVFESALAQDEFEFVEYLQRTLDESLLADLEQLLRDRDETYSRRVAGRLQGDLTTVVKQHERQLALIDDNAELVDKALRLRGLRLERERQELVYLKNEDSSADPAFDQLGMHSLHAKGLIDMEISRRRLPSET